MEQARGWGRQIGLTPAPRHGYVLAKVAVALAMAVLPVLAIAVDALFGYLERFFVPAGLRLKAGA